jgi:hypothetical protein
MGRNGWRVRLENGLTTGPPGPMMKGGFSTVSWPIDRMRSALSSWQWGADLPCLNRSYWTADQTRDAHGEQQRGAHEDPVCACVVVPSRHRPMRQSAETFLPNRCECGTRRDRAPGQGPHVDGVGEQY